MSNGFVHSVKVPRLYKVTAKTIENVEEKGGSLKQLLYEKKHPNLPGVYALALTTLQHSSHLDELLRKSQLLFKEPRLDPWLARVLITELLWGKKSLFSEAKPIKTIVAYENVLRSELSNLDSVPIDLVSNKVRKPRYVRVNTLVTNVQDAIRMFENEGWTLAPKSQDYSSFLTSLSRLNDWWFIQDFHIPELLVFPSGTKFHDHPSYKCSAIVLQDKASCLPAYLLNVTPGSTVLDTCAAPGMKTTHLAAIMKNKGKIYAIERNKRRYETLCKLVGETNSNCVETVNADALTLDQKQYPNVEYILVDPSCSGSGMSDRTILENESSKCAPGRLRSLQSFQVLLLRHALLSFPTAKRIVYSTCSMHPEENEMVIDEILEHIGKSYELLSVKKLFAGNWKNFSSNDYACKDNCLYARPEIDFTNGFFVAVFERNFDVPLPEYKRQKAFVKRKHGDEMNSVMDEHANEKEINCAKKKRRKNKINGKSSNELKALVRNVETNDENEGEETCVKKKRRENKSNGKFSNELEKLCPKVEIIVEDEEEKSLEKTWKKNKLNGESSNEVKKFVPKVELKVEEDEKPVKKKQTKNKFNDKSSNEKKIVPKVERKDEEKKKQVKKKQTKNQLNGSTTIESKTIIVNAEKMAAIKHLEKEISTKKRKRTESNNVEADDIIVTECTMNKDAEKKKKKKRKLVIEDLPNLPIDAQKLKEKKKRFNQPEEVDLMIEDSENLSIEKKKAKKRKKSVDS